MAEQIHVIAIIYIYIYIYIYIDNCHSTGQNDKFHQKKSNIKDNVNIRRGKARLKNTHRWGSQKTKNPSQPAP